jgi:hypothetical protein
VTSAVTVRGAALAGWRRETLEQYEIEYKFSYTEAMEGRSQWPRSLSYELSSPIETLGSWVRIPLKAWMSVYVYSVFVLFCVQVAALRLTDPPSKESYRLCIYVY